MAKNQMFDPFKFAQMVQKLADEGYSKEDIQAKVTPALREAVSVPPAKKEKGKIAKAATSVKDIGVGVAQEFGQTANLAHKGFNILADATAKTILPKKYEDYYFRGKQYQQAIGVQPKAGQYFNPEMLKAKNKSQAAGQVLGMVGTAAVMGPSSGAGATAGRVGLRGAIGGTAKKSLGYGLLGASQTAAEGDVSGGEILTSGLGNAVAGPVADKLFKVVGGSKGVQALKRKGAQIVAPTLQKASSKIEQAFPKATETLSKAGQKIDDFSFFRKGQADKVAEKAGFDIADIKDIKTASKETLNNMKKMLDLGKGAISSKAGAIENQPIRIVGSKVLQPMYKELTENTKKLAGQKNKLLNKIQNEVVDLTSTRNNFLRQLSKKGVRILNNGTVSLDKSRLANTAQNKNMIQDVLDFLKIQKPTVKTTVKSLDKKKAQLFDLLEGKADREVSDEAVNLISGLRKNLIKKIPSEELRNIDKALAQNLGALQKFANASGIKSKFTSDSIRGIKTSEMAGRLLNRSVGRNLEAIEDLVKAYAKNVKGDPNAKQKIMREINKQIGFSDIVENVMGTAPARSFATQTTKSVAEGVDLAGKVAFSPVWAAAEVLRKISNKQLTREQAMNALERLIKANLRGK